jgi:hypothetical protein
MNVSSLTLANAATLRYFLPNRFQAILRNNYHVRRLSQSNIKSVNSLRTNLRVFGVKVGLTLSKHCGRAIAQAVSLRLPTAAARVQTRVWSCGIL